MSSKYLSRNSSTEVSCMKDCAICRQIQTIKLTCSILCRKQCMNRVFARNKGITLFNAPFIFIDLLLTLSQNIKSLGSLNKHDRNVYKRPHKFAYLTGIKSSFACFARAFFIVVHFTSVLLSTTRNDLFLQLSRRRYHMIIFFFLSPNCSHQFHSEIINTYFAS